MFRGDDTRVQTLGLGIYVPQSYTQDELMQAFGYEDHAFAAGVCRNGRIETRAFCEPPAAMVHAAGTEERFRYFRKYAPSMGAFAIRQACEGEIALDAIEALVVTNSSGFVLPGLAEVLGEEYGIGARDALRYNLVGQGCYVAIPAILLAQQLLRSSRVASAAVVCTEPTASIFSTGLPTRSEIVVHLLFGEGAAALVFANGVSAAEAKALPEFLDAEVELSRGTLGHIAVEPRAAWLSRVGPNVPEAGASLLPRVVDRLLRRRDLTRYDIQHWLFHAGGRRVLEGCQHALGLESAAMNASYEVLRKFGNMQSATVLFSLAELQGSHSVRAGDLGVMAAIGPGMTVAAMLLRWD